MDNAIYMNYEQAKDLLLDDINVTREAWGGAGWLTFCRPSDYYSDASPITPFIAYHEFSGSRSVYEPSPDDPTAEDWLTVADYHKFINPLT